MYLSVIFTISPKLMLGSGKIRHISLADLYSLLAVCYQGTGAVPNVAPLADENLRGGYFWDKLPIAFCFNTFELMVKDPAFLSLLKNTNGYCFMELCRAHSVSSSIKASLEGALYS